MNNELRVIELMKKTKARVPCGTWTDPDTGIKYTGIYMLYRMDIPTYAALEEITARAYIARGIASTVWLKRDDELFKHLLIEVEGYVWDEEMFHKNGNFIPGHMYEIRSMMGFDIPLQFIYSADHKFIRINLDRVYQSNDDDCEYATEMDFIFTEKQFIEFIYRMRNSELEQTAICDVTFSKWSPITMVRGLVPKLNKIVPTKDRPDIGIEIVEGFHDNMTFKCNAYIKIDGKWMLLEDSTPTPIPYYEFKQTILEDFNELFEDGKIVEFEYGVLDKSVALYVDDQLKVIILLDDGYHIYDPIEGTEKIIQSTDLDEEFSGKTINKIRWWAE